MSVFRTAKRAALTSTRGWANQRSLGMRVAGKLSCGGSRAGCKSCPVAAAVSPIRTDSSAGERAATENRTRYSMIISNQSSRTATYIQR